MTSETTSPRIHTNGETFLICANRTGFIHLRDQINLLLKDNLNELSLKTSDSNDISTISLDETLPEPPPQSMSTTYTIAIILISILISSLIGLVTIISWLF